MDLCITNYKSVSKMAFTLRFLFSQMLGRGPGSGVAKHSFRRQRPAGARPREQKMLRRLVPVQRGAVNSERRCRVRYCIGAQIAEAVVCREFTGSVFSTVTVHWWSLKFPRPSLGSDPKTFTKSGVSML
jgi:hypothetical protein